MTPDPEASRYRLYAVGRDGVRHLSDTSKEGIGVALVQHVEDGEFEHGERLGIKDQTFEELTGTWLVNPWAPGDRP